MSSLPQDDYAFLSLCIIHLLDLTPAITGPLEEGTYFIRNAAYHRPKLYLDLGPDNTINANQYERNNVAMKVRH
jgi:hypothetical protein